MFARLLPLVVAALGASSAIARPCKRDQCAATLETATVRKMCHVCGLSLIQRPTESRAALAGRLLEHAQWWLGDSLDGCREAAASLRLILLSHHLEHDRGHVQPHDGGWLRHFRRDRQN